VADEYWVSSDESARAVRILLGGVGPRLRMGGSVRLDATGPKKSGSISPPLQPLASDNVIVLFSQSHGLEYDPSIHEALSAELRSVLQRVPSVRLVIKAHPSEPVSQYEDHLAHLPRVTVVRGTAGAGEVAAAASCCVALDSTALFEAVLAGALVVQAVPEGDSMVVQQVAAHRVPLASLGVFLSNVLANSGAMDSALAFQQEQLPGLLAHVGRAGAAQGEALKQLLYKEGEGDAR